MATGQLGIPLGILAICLIAVLGGGGIIAAVFFVAVYFSSPWIVQQLSTTSI